MKPPSKPTAAAAGTAFISIVFILLRLFGVVDFGPGDQGTPTAKAPSSTITDTLQGPQPGTQKIAVPTAAVKQVQATDLGDHEGLHAENPPGLPASELAKRNVGLEQLAAKDKLPLHFPASAPQQRGCTTELVRNYSSRNGVNPREIVLHYTVSPNRPGWSDVNAVVHEFDVSAFQASSNYVIDAEGHCAYIVREVDKAWAQAAANPFSVSIEVINTGHESTYAGKAGLAKVGLVVHDIAKRWRIPLRQGLVAGCLPIKTGVVDHHALGLCGGGHFDISPPYSVGSVVAAANATDQTGSPKTVTTWCRKLNWERGQVRLKKTTPAQRRLARERKALIAKHGYSCTQSGPKKQ